MEQLLQKSLFLIQTFTHFHVTESSLVLRIGIGSGLRHFKMAQERKIEL